MTVGVDVSSFGGSSVVGGLTGRGSVEAGVEVGCWLVSVVSVVSGMEFGGDLSGVVMGRDGGVVFSPSFFSSKSETSTGAGTSAWEWVEAAAGGGSSGGCETVSDIFDWDN